MNDLKCWIAGFPRSGNHRLRQVVYSLLWRKPFEFGNVIEDGYKALQEAGYKKTHLKGNLIEGPAIYSIRNEQDIIKSMQRYFHKEIPTIEEASDKVYKGDWKKDGLAEKWGSREQNIQSFINRPETLIVQYEAFGIQQVRDIAKFLGLEPLDEIVEWVDEKRMLQKEKDFIAKYAHTGTITHIDEGIV